MKATTQQHTAARREFLALALFASTALLVADKAHSAECPNIEGTWSGVASYAETAVEMREDWQGGPRIIGNREEPAALTIQVQNGCSAIGGFIRESGGGNVREFNDQLLIQPTESVDDVVATVTSAARFIWSHRNGQKFECSGGFVYGRKAVGKRFAIDFTRPIEMRGTCVANQANFLVRLRREG